MATLLLQCVAPLQAWGTQSEYIVRDTGREPSKSGIVGLLCAALGRDRTQPMDDLAALRMGVRVDQEGKILRDYHTIFENKVVSTRYYLTDALFLVGLEGERSALAHLHEALRRPRWNLFLGRKSCPPARPPYLRNGLVEQSLFAALAQYPWLGQDMDVYANLDQLRLIYDDPDNGNERRNDHPISFEKGQRRFQPRRVTTAFIDRPPFESDASYPVLATVKVMP